MRSVLAWVFCGFFGAAYPVEGHRDEAQDGCLRRHPACRGEGIQTVGHELVSLEVASDVPSLLCIDNQLPIVAPSGVWVVGRAVSTDDEHVERLQFIKSAQRFGPKLEDISEVLRFRDRGERLCDYVIDVVRREVDDLNNRIREMRRLKGELETLLDEAEQRRSLEREKYWPLITHRTGCASDTSTQARDSRLRT